jgi:two-component system response regulator NreC
MREAPGFSFTYMTAHLGLAVSRSNGHSGRSTLPVQVLLADDHAVVRREIRSLLECEEDFQVIAEADEVSSLMRRVYGHLPHVLVLDLQMPNGPSIDAIRRLHDRVPETEIVVLTSELSPLFAQRAIDAGATCFVLKDQAGSELRAAVRTAAAGGEYVSPRVAAGMEGLRRAISGDGLTTRETEIVRLVALGYTSAEVASKLRLSRRTVETHRAHIHRKLQISTRAELVRYALSHHLVAV